MGLHLNLLLAATGSSWIGLTYTIALVLIGLNLVILVHELGHFLVARACGVKCEKFYVWFDVFGLRLLRFRWGETEYGLGVLPLGGYVKMLGQEDNPARLQAEIERAKLENPNPCDTLRHDIEAAEQALYDPRSYLAKSVPQRMAIISAGVVMNVVFAFLAAAVAYQLGVEQIRCAVGSVFAGEAAWRADIRPGDRIETVADRPVRRFNDLRAAISLGNIGRGVPVTVQRIEPDGTAKQERMTVEPDRLREAPTIGISNGFDLLLRDPPALPGSPAALANPPFRPGDRIVQIDEMPVQSYGQVHALLARQSDRPVRITVQRGPAPEMPPDQSGQPELVTITVPPNPMRQLGLLMRMGPITAIQQHSPAAEAGLQPGDVIEQVDGRPVADPVLLPEMFRQLALAGRSVVLTVRRPGANEPLQKVVPLRLAPYVATPLEVTSPAAVWELGIAYQVVPQVQAVEPGSAAQAAGIQPGRRVLKVRLIPPERTALSAQLLGCDPDAVPLELAETSIDLSAADSGWTAVSYAIQMSLPGTQVGVHFDDGSSATLLPQTSGAAFDPERGFLFEPLAYVETASSLLEAAQLGAAETWESLTLIFRTLQKLGTGQVSPKGLAGPVGIAHIAYGYASRGFASLLIFLCLISANLAVLNFIPIPVLDGGHMLFLAYEGIRGKPPSERVLTGLMFAGLIFLLSLMIWVTGMDVIRLVYR